MSVRYASRLVVQTGARVAQAARDQAARGVKDTATAASNSSSRGVRRVSTSIEAKHATLTKAASEAERKRAEESLRTVMFLTMWGPN